MSGKLFVISAPSGAGKTTLINKLLTQVPAGYKLQRLTTCTTRAPRPGDIQGKDYHFLTHKDFKQKIATGYFLEWSQAYTHYYGTPCTILDALQAGQSYLLIIDRCGAEQIMKKIPSTIGIWIYTKSIQELRQRLKGRGTEEPEKIQFRLEQAKKELALEQKKPMYQHQILNDDFEVALIELKRIIFSYLD